MINKKDLELFIEESNLIEGVTGDQAFNDSLRAWEYMRKIYKLSHGDIKIIHELIMQNISNIETGDYRKINVRVGYRVAPRFEKVKDLMSGWIALANSMNTRDFDDKIREDIIKQLHIDFEKIHPFEDGNGRAGRLILNWQRVRNGLPILIIEADERQQYYDWFHKIDYPS